MNGSGFLSNFSNSLVTNDILSKTSSQSTYTLVGITCYARYIVLGDLLIQFSDMSTWPNPSASLAVATGRYSITYPIAYASKPYCVLVSGFKATGTNPPVEITLDNSSLQTNSYFTFKISGNDGWLSWIAIGPRPTTI